MYENCNFEYCAANATGISSPSARYLKEDVCLCYYDPTLDFYFEKMVLGMNQHNTKMDYAKLLNIPEVPINVVGGCACKRSWLGD